MYVQSTCVGLTARSPVELICVCLNVYKQYFAPFFFTVNEFSLFSSHFPDLQHITPHTRLAATAHERDGVNIHVPSHNGTDSAPSTPDDVATGAACAVRFAGNCRRCE
jgi:hypothetical protein